MATIALTGTFWKAPGDVAWASAPYTIRLVRPFAILGEAAHPRWSRSGTASAEGAISEALTVPDEGTAHFELVAPDGNIYTAHLAADDTPTVEAWMAAAYTTPTDISTTQSLIDAALEDFAVGAAPVDSVFGREGAVVADAADYAAFYAPLSHASATNNPHAVTAEQVGALTEAAANALYADIAHDHDATYAALVHAHAIADVTGLQGALDGKAAASHAHAWADITDADAETAAAIAAALNALTPGDIGAEPALGNPGVNGYVLASQTDGTRSWVEMAAGGGGGDFLPLAGGTLSGNVIFGGTAEAQFGDVDERGRIRYLNSSGPKLLLEAPPFGRVLVRDGTGDLVLAASGFTVGDAWGFLSSGTGARIGFGPASEEMSAEISVYDRMQIAISGATSRWRFDESLYPGLGYFRATSTGSIQPIARLTPSWADNTHATRKGRVQLIVTDYGDSYEALRVEATGSAAAIGFLGAAAIPRPTVTGSRGGNAALASLLDALEALGLITDSSS